MSVIMYGSVVGENDVVLLCQECLCETDRVSLDEARDMSRRGYEVFCMECDNWGADQVPECLAGDPPYTLCINGHEYAILWPEDKTEVQPVEGWSWEAQAQRVRRLWELWRSRPLASSPYLRDQDTSREVK